ncbi:MAG: hypothetical protein AABZ31_09125 [Bdellovibrionota bacterium]
MLKAEYFTLETATQLMDMRPTLKQTASFFRTSEDTVQRRIKQWSGLSFTEFRDLHSAKLRLRLIQKAVQLAEASNTTMLIFALKNLCGWSDDNNDVQKQSVITLAYSLDKPSSG